MVTRFITFLVAVFVSASFTHAQEDTSLNGRLAAFFHANDVFNIEKIMDFTYPKLFTLVPREELAEAMKTGYDNDEVKIEIDSIKADRLYPLIKIEDGSYIRVDYSMIMRVKLKTIDADTTGTIEMLNEMKAAFKEEYGTTAVHYDNATRSIRIEILSAMVAIKDSFSQHWTFVNLKQDDMTKELLGSEIVARLSALKSQ